MGEMWSDNHHLHYNKSFFAGRSVVLQYLSCARSRFVSKKYFTLQIPERMMYRVVTCAKKLVSPSALENACLWYGVEGWRNITFLSRRSLASTSFRTIVSATERLVTYINSVTQIYHRNSCNLFQNNIILMGSPGAGKTVVGKTLASQLDMFWVDVDDDVLEPTWQMSVGEKVTILCDTVSTGFPGGCCLSITSNCL